MGRAERITSAPVIEVERDVFGRGTGRDWNSDLSRTSEDLARLAGREHQCHLVGELVHCLPDLTIELRLGAGRAGSPGVADFDVSGRPAELRVESGQLNLAVRVPRRHLSDAAEGDDDVAVVEADGVGGAILRVVEGNYPVDYYTREEKEFPTEAGAVRAAEALSAAESSV